ENGERVALEQLAERLVRRRAGDPPAHDPAEPGRIADPHLARGLPEPPRVCQRNPAVVDSYLRIREPEVEVGWRHRVRIPRREADGTPICPRVRQDWGDGEPAAAPQRQDRRERTWGLVIGPSPPQRSRAPTEHLG